MITSCLFLNHVCQGCDNMSDDMRNQIMDMSKPTYRKRIVKLQPEQATELESYMLRDETAFGRAIRYQVYKDKNFDIESIIVEDECPVPTTPPTSPKK